MLESHHNVIRGALLHPTSHAIHPLWAVIILKTCRTDRSVITWNSG